MDPKSPLFLLLFTLSFLPFYALVWLVVSSILRTISGFSWKTSKEYPTTAASDRVTFSTVRIGGVTFNNCLHIIRLDGGFLLQLTRIFLGGSRYIPDAGFAIVRKSQSFLGDTVLEMRVGKSELTFFGKSADFVEKYRRRPDPTER